MEQRLKNSIGMDMSGIKLVPYNPLWAEVFEHNKARLQELLKDIPIGGIEHIGSTAIPTCPFSKPVIDIGIRHDDSLFNLDDFRLRLLDGLYEKGDCETNWNPGAVKDRSNDTMLGMLHIARSYRIDEMLRFKRYLIEHPEVARDYAAKKQICADSASNLGSYSKRKGELIIDDINTVAHLKYVDKILT